MSGITGSMLSDDMKLSAIKVGIGLLIIAVLLFSAWLFFRYKRRKQLKPSDRKPEEGSAFDVLKGVFVTAEELHDASAPIPDGPYIFVVPVTQAMLGFGVYTNEGSSGWLMERVGLVGHPLALTAEELQSGRVILRDVLPGGAGQPKVSVLHLPLLEPVVPVGSTPERVKRLFQGALQSYLRMLFEAIAEAELEPGTILKIPMIGCEGVNLSPHAYQEVFAEAFTEAADAVTGGPRCRRTLVSYLGVVSVANIFSGEVCSAYRSFIGDVAAVAAAPAPNPELDPNGELEGAGLEGAGLDGASLDGASLDGASLDGASLDSSSSDSSDRGYF